ncbi:glycosyltransferase [Pseudobacteriovorax antillogorgiicola]|uniref:Glycosyltransferase 2-like domain-containing protein n=1 Tax=Pseudobacteriovorax antillogorgiicola TaxID=1513793 RepID=A0A1Y6CVT7_9BACT|nr:glycosyltransferase [Pseudobacteriovorax antillogorgiicola]TCS42237.1 hypothetical protein EDD56_1428 [Pseudobacteriovorax antillogorgiicola]SMF82548.1 hypothetical protein SAMN06296036_1428 [Pseudobacteriovorax antillogorgiicola]
MKLSIVIPVAPGDRSWTSLQEHLKPDASCEIILATADCAGDEDRRLYAEAQKSRWRLVSSAKGRAQQLNRGARAAIGQTLWFLHGDSKLDAESLKKVFEKTQNPLDGLYFLDLKFDRDQLWQMMVNEIGVYVRSHFLKIPFGDQGFLIDRKKFLGLGGFDESAAFGEDHLFVWKCHHQGIAVKPLGANIQTSSRKYEKQGWLKTTLNHLYLTGKQAKPELLELAKNQWKV